MAPPHELDGATLSKSHSSKTYRGHFFCLCYSSRQRSDRSYYIDVIPIAVPDDNHNALPLEKESNLLTVCRARMMPLDPPLIHRHCGKDFLTRDYLLSLLCFADWDNYSAASYIWPKKIHSLFTSRQKNRELCEKAVNHPFRYSKQGRSSRSKIFLFVLCCEHIGLSSRISPAGVCCEETLVLLSQLSTMCVDEDENHVLRTASRIGKDYQVILPPMLLTPTEEDSQQPSSKCYSYLQVPPRFTDSNFQMYFKYVQKLREKNLQAGQLIEAPISPKDFEDVIGQETSLTSQNLAICFSRFRSEHRKHTSHFVVREVSHALKNDVINLQPSTSIATSSNSTSASNAHNPPRSGIILHLIGEVGDIDVPIEYCRTLSLPFDEALKILYNCSFDVATAVTIVTNLIKRSAFELTMLPEEMKIFLLAAKK